MRLTCAFKCDGRVGLLKVQDSIALYIRLSKEDDNKLAESESVTYQRSLLYEFADKKMPM